MACNNNEHVSYDNDFDRPLKILIKIGSQKPERYIDKSLLGNIDIRTMTIQFRVGTFETGCARQGEKGFFFEHSKHNSLVTFVLKCFAFTYKA